jgi:putative glycosyltransferase (TIGR04372 family)
MRRFSSLVGSLQTFIRRQNREIRLGGWRIVIRKICTLAELALAIPLQTVCMNPVCQRIWVKWLRGRVEFFGMSHSLGEMAGTVDYYLLRRRHLNVRTHAIYLAGDPNLVNPYFASFQAKALGSSRVHVVQNRLVCRVLKPLARQLWFSGQALSSFAPDYSELTARYDLHLDRRFPESERQRGRLLMEQLGLPRSAQFVAVQAREAGYEAPRGVSHHHTFRDVDIETFIPAIQYLTQQGFWVVRIGEPTVKPLPSMEHVIDYARSSLKSDFLDIALLAECEFFVACCSGPKRVAHVFKKPILCTNAISLTMIPFCASDLWIPKLLWSQAEGRYLTLGEIVNRGIGAFEHTRNYVAAGITIHANTAEEILEATQEMLQLHRGTRVYSEDERGVQEAVNQLLPSHYRTYRTRARLCASFIRRHPDLIPQRVPVPTVVGT